MVFKDLLLILRITLTIIEVSVDDVFIVASVYSTFGASPFWMGDWIA